VAIEFHCSQCSKLIRAPDDAGGRRAKCPYCQQSVYVPSAEPAEPIPVAPIDDEDQLERLRREDRAFYTEVVKEVGGDDAGAGSRGPSGKPGDGSKSPQAYQEDVDALIVRYLRAMQRSELEEAEDVVELLRGDAEQAREHIQPLLMDEMPPSGVERMPPALLHGFLRKLQERLWG